MIVKLIAEDVTNSDGDVIRDGDTLDLWGCAIRGISTIKEEYISRGSKHRTLENAIKRDITGNYRTWEIGYELLDYSRLQSIIEIYKLQCEQLACLKLSITNPCGEADCDCSSLKPGVAQVTMDMGSYDYSDNGTFVTGLTLKFEESNPCSDCNDCG